MHAYVPILLVGFGVLASGVGVVAAVVTWRRDRRWILAKRQRFKDRERVPLEAQFHVARLPPELTFEDFERAMKLMSSALLIEPEALRLDDQFAIEHAAEPNTVGFAMLDGLLEHMAAEGRRRGAPWVPVDHGLTDFVPGCASIREYLILVGQPVKREQKRCQDGSA